MSISSISSGTAAANIENWQAMMRQRQQDFQSLGNSLKSGDLGGAQQAYSELAALTSGNASGTSSASSTGPVKQDFATLGKDLTAGNLTQAQTDFQQMKTDLQSTLSQNGGSAGVHHHSHHSHKVDTSSSQSATPSSSDTTLSSAVSGLLSQYASPGASDSMTASVLNLLG